MCTDGRTEGHADRRKNMKKELGAFRDYAKMHKNMLGNCKYSALSCLVTQERRINLCDSVARHSFHFPYNKVSVGIFALT
jgi:hypothetical protein